MKSTPCVCLLLSVFFGAPIATEAAYIFKNGKLIKSEEVATMSVQEHYSAAMGAYQQQSWGEVIHHCVIVIKNFGASPFAQESYFYLGVAYFHTGEVEFANRFFTKYLKKQATPKYFEEAIQYKFKIAEKYHKGAKKHVLGMENMPKWVPARTEAIGIYDEVLTALPHHELAAQALFGKAQLLLKEEEYKSSIETYQTLIRRFPKHPLAAESYIGVCEVYLAQAQAEYPDQDFLDLAEINLRKFRMNFPGDEKIALAERTVLEMREVFASDLYDTGRFYERTSKPHAAHIYYTRILVKYPDTKVSALAGKRVSRMNIQSTPAQTAEPVQAIPAAPFSEESLKSPLLNLQVQGLSVEAEEPIQPLEEQVTEPTHRDLK
jgi:outer membrane protein assembly factor BamD (BamD/ComL family)